LWPPSLGICYYPPCPLRADSLLASRPALPIIVMQNSNSLLEDLSDHTSAPDNPTTALLPNAAFEFLPDAVFLFGVDRRLVKSNQAAALLQSSEPLPGTPCCEMFWGIKDAKNCLVDR